MKKRACHAVNVRKMTASFFLALVLFISLSTVVSAQERTEITAYPGQTIRNNELYFKNTGVIPFANVYAVASGSAADWVSPTRIDFGSVGGLQKVTKKYTITVPEDAIVGQDYTLTWDFYSEERGYEGSVHCTIHVTQFFLFIIPLWIWIVIILVLVVIPIIVIAIIIGRERARKKPVTRICPQCGRTLPPDVKFCPYCGKTLGE